MDPITKDPNLLDDTVTDTGLAYWTIGFVGLSSSRSGSIC